MARPLSRAATTFAAGANQMRLAGARAGAPTKIRLAAAGDFSGGGSSGIRRDLVNGGTSHY